MLVKQPMKLPYSTGDFIIKLLLRIKIIKSRFIIMAKNLMHTLQSGKGLTTFSMIQTKKTLVIDT